MKTLLSRFDKCAMAALPRAAFKGRIILIQTADEADKAVAYLMQYPLLGVDTETRPSFRRGQINKVALLQVATEDTCFLFRLNRTGMTASIVKLLQDCSCKKIGLSLRDDFSSLYRRELFAPCGFVELQDYVKDLGIEDQSLQKLYANIFGEKISKGQRLSNWEADVLTEGQKAYAALDAWACIRIYKELESLRQTKDYTLEVVEQASQKNGDEVLPIK